MNVPKLRFKEFSKEWSTHKLSDLTELTSSKRIYLNEYKSEGVPFYRGKEISELKKGNKINDLLFISNEKYEEIKQKYGTPQINDILITSVGTLGNVYRIKSNDKFYFKDGNLIWLKNIRCNSKFLEYSLEYNKKKMLDSSIGSTQKALTIEGLSKIKISLPSEIECKKIGNILSLLDKKIELQSKKIEALKLYKLCILKYIFSSATIKTKLKSIGNIKKGEQINSEELSKSGSYYMLNGGTEPSGYLEKYNTLENTITISEGGNSCGYVKYNKCKFWCGGHCYSIENKMIDNHYLYQLLKFNENKIMRLRIGSGLPNIQKKDLENFELSIHEKNDQHKIAKLLIKFDTKIELEQDLLNLLLNLKKGLMQNMFV